MNEILPFPCAWIGDGETFHGWFVCVDGSKFGYAAMLFTLTFLTVKGITKIMSRLATSKSKLGKRNAYVHENLSRILGNAITSDVLDRISPQLTGRSLKI